MWGQAGEGETAEAQGEAWGAGREGLHGGGLGVGMEDEGTDVGMEHLGIKASGMNTAMRSRKGAEGLMTR